MIRATPPRGKPIREWICCYCPAHGPADDEAHTRQLTQEHLAACHGKTRMTTDERIESLTSTTVYGDNLEWLIAELRRAREHLRRIACGEFCTCDCQRADRYGVMVCEHRGCAKEGLG